ncbi:MAG: hypothetical protein PHX35_04185 [Candidatus Bipolaricaulis anaerobius]|nr:hypothetical protein [Candidatus Bipolaricaulis anaerobius]
MKLSWDKNYRGRIRTLILAFVGLLLTGGLVGCGLLTGGLAPATPTDLSVTNGTLADRVRLAWSPVAEAGGYEVWRAESSDGEYMFVGATAHPAYDDTTAMPGTTYWYKVRACNRAGCSEFTPALSGKALSNLVPSAPTGVSASQGTFTDRVRVTWQASPRASAYHVYRGTAATGPFTMIAVVEGTSYDDVEVTLGQTYWYKLRACNSEGCSVLSSADVSGYAASQVPSAPEDVTASDETEDGKVVVSWQAVAGATSYLIYRALAADAAPLLVGTVTETTYEDTAVEADTAYWYWVRACNETGCSPLSSPDSGSPGAGGDEEPPPPPPDSTSLL